jgi:UDPglucose 6-dehydrogenase
VKLTVVGTGYVGLVTGACLAEVGNDVLCLDVDPVKIDALILGRVPIYEPGLQDLIRRNVAGGRLAFTSDPAVAARFGEVQFIAVGTPPGEDGSADLQYVLSAARAIAQHMDCYRLVVNKSTVPVGTADKVHAVMREVLDQRGSPLEFAVASNPEFLKEGAAIEDFMRPDRIVIGTDSERASQLLRELYAPFQRHHERLIQMDVRSAELTKYAANAMLATRISFMNEMANLADKVGADIESVRKGIGSDARIGYSFLYAGCGYGGSCFPKDVRALIRTAQQDAGLELKVLRAVEAANAEQRRVLPRKIKQRFGDDLGGRALAVWGLAFKPNTDDVREAPSRSIVAELLSAGARVAAYDPAAIDQARQVFGECPGLSYAPDAMSALEGADALVIVTEWKEFRSPDFDAIAARLKSPVIFDGRNLYRPQDMRARGFEYYAIGRGG